MTISEGKRGTYTSGRKTCLGCGGISFTEDQSRGENICASCGLVVSDHTFDRGPEWRAFTAEERLSRERTGAPMRFIIADKGLSTAIDWRNKDAAGRPITGKSRTAIYRMRKWNIRSRAHGTNHGNLISAMSEMERLGSQLAVPRNTQETAALIYRKAMKKKLVRGRSIDAAVAASVYLACRIHHTPRQLDEVVVESRSTRKEIGQSVRLVLSRLNVNVPVASARDLIPRLSSDLGFKIRTVKKAAEIIDNASEKGITMGKDPGGIAGAALYIAGILEEDKCTQRDIARAAHVTEITIRSGYKNLVHSLGISLEMDSTS
ncbi:MAG: TFIIB-type zinc ribbon-containing protein [Candidatus Thorarchaeota archaeon]